MHPRNIRQVPELWTKTFHQAGRQLEGWEWCQHAKVLGLIPKTAWTPEAAMQVVSVKILATLRRHVGRSLLTSTTEDSVSSASPLILCLACSRHVCHPQIEPFHPLQKLFLSTFLGQSQT